MSSIKFILQFAFSFIVMCPLWNRKWNKGKVFKNYVGDMLFLFKMACRRKKWRAVYTRRLTFPLCCRLGGYQGVANRRPNSIRIHGLGLLGYYELLVLNLTLTTGCLSMSLSMLNIMCKSAHFPTRLVGLLGKFDLAILLNLWKRQLQDYYRERVWLDPDKITWHHDELTKLFLELGEADIHACYAELTKVSSVKAVIYEVMAHYYESCFNIEKAFECVEKSKGRLGEERGIHNKEKALKFFVHPPINQSTIDPMLFKALQVYLRANLLSVGSLCQKGELEAHLKVEEECYSFQTKYFYHAQSFSQMLRYTTNAQYIAKCSDVIGVGGGVLVSYINNRFVLIKDTSHLNITHLKLFTSEIVVYDEEEVLIKKINEIESICERAFIISGTGWSYYHWMFETLPNIRIYVDAGLNQKMPIIFPYQLSAWQMESIRMIWGDELEIYPHVSQDCFIKEAYFVTHASRDLIPSTSAINFLRSHFYVKPEKPFDYGKRIYITRDGVNSARKMMNAKSVLEWAKQNMFIIVNPEQMSLREQMNFFSDADIVLAEGGAALSNLVMCPKNARIIVMAAARAWAETYSSLAGRLGQNFVAVLGESFSDPSPYYLWSAFDYIISLDDLNNAFSYAIKNTRDEVNAHH